MKPHGLAGERPAITKSRFSRSPTLLPVTNCIIAGSFSRTIFLPPFPDGATCAGRLRYPLRVTPRVTPVTMLSDSAILKKIEQQPKRTAAYKQMTRELGVHGDARRELFERLKQLVASGQLQQVGPARYAIPQAAAGKNMAVGRLSMHRDGFGFVIPEPTSLDERLKARLSGDIFIPPPAVGSAMHGDRVLVEIGNIRPDGRAEGRIVRLVGRAHSTVVGKFHYGSRRNHVTPIDQKITQEIVIPPGLEYPEKSAAGAEDEGV